MAFSVVHNSPGHFVGPRADFWHNGRWKKGGTISEKDTGGNPGAVRVDTLQMVRKFGFGTQKQLFPSMSSFKSGIFDSDAHFQRIC